METQLWTEILSRVVPYGPDDLDDLLEALDFRGSPGREIFPPVPASLSPHAELTPPDTVCVGIRVSATLCDAVDHALRLIFLAAERRVEIIVLAETDTTGFERFGFRIERIVGADAAARSQCETQIRRFWNIDLVL